MKHCKYSKSKEVRPYKVTVFTYRYDGVYTDEHFCKTEELALALVNFLKSFEPELNDYYFGSQYKIDFIGNDKFI